MIGGLDTFRRTKKPASNVVIRTVAQCFYDVQCTFHQAVDFFILFEESQILLVIKIATSSIEEQLEFKKEID
jgi:hypothetical protein